MQERFRMFRRAGGNVYSRDKITGRSESLGTSDRTQAKQLLAARNQAAAQPQLNRTMAKAYLSAKSPELLTRTWADVMEHYSVTGVESTRKRKATAFRSRPFRPFARSCVDGHRGRAFVGRPRARAGGQLGAPLPAPPAQLRLASRMAADAGHGGCGRIRLRKKRRQITSDRAESRMIIITTCQRHGRWPRTAARKRFEAQPPLKSKARGRLGSKTRTDHVM